MNECIYFDLMDLVLFAAAGFVLGVAVHMYFAPND